MEPRTDSTASFMSGVSRLGEGGEPNGLGATTSASRLGDELARRLAVTDNNPAQPQVGARLPPLVPAAHIACRLLLALLLLGWLRACLGALQRRPVLLQPAATGVRRLRWAPGDLHASVCVLALPPGRVLQAAPASSADRDKPWMPPSADHPSLPPFDVPQASLALTSQLSSTGSGLPPPHEFTFFCEARHEEPLPAGVPDAQGPAYSAQQAGGGAAAAAVAAQQQQQQLAGGGGSGGPGEGLVSKWRQKERLKTTAVALVMCLNIGERVGVGGRVGGGWRGADASGAGMELCGGVRAALAATPPPCDRAGVDPPDVMKCGPALAQRPLENEHASFD